jgi:hypothetical protein
MIMSKELHTRTARAKPTLKARAKPYYVTLFPGVSLGLLLATALVVVATGASAESYTYMCKVGSKSYPVTVTTPSLDQLWGGTLTWRGKTYRNVTATQENCKVEFQVDNRDATLILCTATRGYADLTVIDNRRADLGGGYECRMR